MAALWPVENDDPLWGFILNDDPLWGFISPHGYLRFFILYFSSLSFKEEAFASSIIFLPSSNPTMR
jgi:hypothetical protein